MKDTTPKDADASTPHGVQECVPPTRSYLERLNARAKTYEPGRLVCVESSEMQNLLGWVLSGDERRAECEADLLAARERIATLEAKLAGLEGEARVAGVVAPVNVTEVRRKAMEEVLAHLRGRLDYARAEVQEATAIQCEAQEAYALVEAMLRREVRDGE